MQQARLLDEQITDVTGLLRHVRQGRPKRRRATLPSSCQRTPSEIVIRTIEAKTGLASTHRVHRAALDANEYRQLAQVHADLADAGGLAPVHGRAWASSASEAATFEELREVVLAVAQKGVDYVRFKGLGEMDADELRETTMDPSSRTLVQVTMEDAASADLGVLDADGRPGRAAAGVHRGERAARGQPGRVGGNRCQRSTPSAAATSSPAASRRRCARRISTTRCRSSSGARCPTSATA